MVNIFCEGSGLDVEYGKKFFDGDVKLTTNKIIGPCGAQYMQIGKEEIEQYFNGEKDIGGDSGQYRETCKRRAGETVSGL